MELNSLVKNIVLKVDKLSSLVNSQLKTTSADYPSFICNKVSKELEVSALKIIRSDKRKHFFTNTLGCVVCSKPYQFKIHWDELKAGKDINLSIFSNQQICEHPEQQASRYVRGKDREEIAKVLENSSIKQYQDKQLQLINQNLLQTTGNLQTFQSPDVLMKIRSDQKAADDLHYNDLVDVYLKSTSDDNVFIQNVSSFPFSCQVNFSLRI